MHFPRGKKISAIFYFDCEHILFAYLIKQNQKKFANFIKKIFVDFKSNENRILLER